MNEIMDDRIERKGHFLIHWWRRLAFRIPFISILLVSLLIFISYVVLYQMTRPNLKETANLLYSEAGEKIISSIYLQTSIAATLAKSIANTMVQLPKDSHQVKKVFPNLLSLNPEFDQYIAGGGMWPEPFQFSSDIERHSFFWGKDKQGSPYFVDDYNDLKGKGYHQEEWYVPVKYLEKDGVYWSKSYTDPYTKQPMVTVSVPMYRGDSYYGVVTIDLYLGRLQELLIESSKIFEGYSFITDRNNYFVGKPPIEILSGLKVESLSDVATKIPEFAEVLNDMSLHTSAYMKQYYENNKPHLKVAALIDKYSPDINKDESRYIASHINNYERNNLFGKHLMTSILIGADSEDVNIFNLPGLNWRLVTVAPASFKESSFISIVKINFYAQLAGIIFVFILGFFLLHKHLIEPLDNIVTVLKESDGTQRRILKVKENNELGAIAFWFNRYIKENNEFNLLLNDKVEERTKELRVSARRLDNAMSVANDGVWEWNLDTNIVLFSPRYYTLSGYQPNEFPSHFSEWKKRIHEDDINDAIGMVTDYLSGEIDVYDMEFRFLNKDKSYRWVRARGRVVEFKPDGSAISFVGTHSDIHERKQIEQDIIDKSVELQIAKDEADEANREKSRFLSNMSHELRTPMHAILSFTDLSIKRIEDEKTSEYLGYIKTSGNRLTKLLNNLLDLAKLESGKLIPNFSEGNLTVLIEESVNELQSLVQEKSLLIDLKMDKVNEGLFDKSFMQQVMTNLMSNAIKFSPESGCIKVRCAKRTDILNGKEMSVLEVIVEDQGIGIPSNELNLIFDTFTQSSETMTQAGGTGLGLPICKEIMKVHNGKIWAVNTKLKYPDSQFSTAFHIVIPTEQVLS